MTPLVLIHGLMGGARQWDGQHAALGDGREVISLDLPGFGGHHAAEAPASIEGFARFVLDQLDLRGVKRFDLLGHSMGGMIAQEVTRMAPGRVARLVLYGTGAIGILPGRFESVETSKQRARADGPKLTARRIAATWFMACEADPAYAGCAALAEQSSLQAILAGLDAMQGWSGVENLARIQAPTLVIWGDHDRTYPWSQTEHLWRKIPGARLAVVPGCAHAVHLEKPQIFNSLLLDFLGLGDSVAPEVALTRI